MAVSLQSLLNGMTKLQQDLTVLAGEPVTPSRGGGKSKGASGDDTLDPVMVGDIITLGDTDKATAGLLYGARAELRCGIQAQGRRAALNFNDYALRGE